MIQISAAPATTMPILGEPQVDTGAEPTISTEFAAILAAQSGSPAQDQAAGIGQALAQPSAIAQAPSGKPGGKVLPLAAIPPVGLIAEGMPDAAQKSAGLPEAGSLQEQDAAALDPALPEVLLQPMAFAMPFPPSPLTAPRSAKAQEIAARAAPSVAAPAGQAQSRAALVQADLPQTPGISSQKPAQQQLAVLPQQALRIEMPATAAPPASAPSTLTIATVDFLMPPIAPAPVQGADAVTLAQPNGLALNPALQPEETVTNSPALIKNAETAGGNRPAGVAQVPAPGLLYVAQPRFARARNEQPASAKSTARAGDPVSPSEALADIAPTQPQAIQPVPAKPQEQSITAPGPAVSAHSRPEAPADFTTLVDRLVAAREAAQSTMTPQAVHAAIAHAEFGKVSLRFEQQDGGLSVAMTSPDPDFARSVMAAAPASQQSLDNGDSRGSASRQDSAPAQSQSLSQPQSQAHNQTGGHGAQRNQAAQPLAASAQRQSSTPNSAANGDAPAGRRRGIFA